MQVKQFGVVDLFRPLSASSMHVEMCVCVCVCVCVCAWVCVSSTVECFIICVGRVKYTIFRAHVILNMSVHAFIILLALCQMR